MNDMWYNWRELRNIFRLLITVKLKNLIYQICLVYLNITAKKNETFNTLIDIMFSHVLVDVTQAHFGFKCREIERKKEVEKEKRRDGERDDDEKRSSWIEGIRNFLRGGKIVALLATLPAHGRQSESNFWCGLLAPWETIVHRDRWTRPCAWDNCFPGSRTYLSVRH